MALKIKKTKTQGVTFKVKRLLYTFFRRLTINNLSSVLNSGYHSKLPSIYLRSKNRQRSLFLGFTTSMLIALSACVSLPQNNSDEPSNTVEKTAEKPAKQDIYLAPLDGWNQRKFTTKATEYSLSTLDKQTVLSAHSDASATMLYKRINIDLNKTPYFNWRWQVEKTFSHKESEQHRDYDDFPARVYIAIKPAFLEIKPRAISYVWASNAKQFSTWPNPYSKNVVTLALQSGDVKAGQWQSEKRNLKEDIQQLFNMPIEMIEGIAIMSDTDNTLDSAVAHYSEFFFSAE